MRAYIKELVNNALAKCLRFGRITRSDPAGFAQMDGRVAGRADPIRIKQHYGFRSRPKVGSEVYGMAVAGGAANMVSVATETPGTGPDNQDEGDVEVYSEHGQRIILSSDGGLYLNGNLDVIVNGGSAPVGRVGDQVKVGKLRWFMQTDMSMPPQTEFKITYLANQTGATEQTLANFKIANVTLINPTSGNTNEVELVGKITTGAPHLSG